jgi:hypothetical protein
MVKYRLQHFGQGNMKELALLFAIGLRFPLLVRPMKVRDLANQPHTEGKTLLVYIFSIVPINLLSAFEIENAHSHVHIVY